MRLPNYPATDAQSAIQVVPIANDVTIAPSTLYDAVDGSAYELQFAANGGGGGPYTYVLASGSLPTGLSLTSSGSLSGVPNAAAGTYSFSVTASNSYGLSATVPLQVQLANAPLAVAGTPYLLAIPFVNGGQFAVSSGSLPPGLTLMVNASFNAFVVGTPTTPGTYTFSIQESRAFSNVVTATNAYTLFVDSPIVPANQSDDGFRSGQLAHGHDRQPVLVHFHGDGRHRHLFHRAEQRPDTEWPGLGHQHRHAQRHHPGYDCSGNLQLLRLLLRWLRQSGNAEFHSPGRSGPEPGPGFPARRHHRQSVHPGADGIGRQRCRLHFALTSGSLPTGLTLSPGGVISGTIPPGTLITPASFTVTLTDSTGASISELYSLTINPAVTVSPGTLPAAEAGAAYSQTLTATGGSGTGYTFALTQGDLPPGLMLAANGTLSGSLASNVAGGYYTFTVTASDSAGATGSNAYSLLVDAAMSVGPPNLPNVVVNTPYSQQFTATGGSGIHSFAITAGSLPPGLTLSPTGLISGTVPPTTTPGSYDFTLTVTDSLGVSCISNCSIDVDPIIETWTGAVSTAWSNPANWSGHFVPAAAVNVTIPTAPSGKRLPVLDTTATLDNLAIQPGASLTLAGHNLTAYGTFTNQGTFILQGNETVTLASGNDTREGTWEYVGDGTGKTLALGEAGYFNLMIADTHTHPDTFQTANNLTVGGTLTITCGAFTASGGTVTTAGVNLSGTGVLNAPSLLNDSGNWTVTGGTFNPDGGTVAFTGTGTQKIVTDGRAFCNVSHTANDTLGLVTFPLTVNGALTNAAGTFQSDNLSVTVAGPTSLTGGTFSAGRRRYRSRAD